MVLVFALCVLVLVSVIGWLVQHSAAKAFNSYSHAFKKEASARMGELFLFLDPAQLWTANLMLCGAATAVAYVLTGSVAICVIAGGGALIAPQYSIRRLRKQRLHRFDEQLPDLLMALSGALRAGSGVQAALRHIVVQSPPPLAQEFGLMLRHQRMGVPLDQALADLYTRMPTEGTALVISSLKIASHSGGSLAETLEGIASTLRARLQLLGRVHALTSQGRLQAWIMACLPLLLAAVLHYLDPDSMAVLWDTPMGWSVLGTIAFLEIVGIVFIRRIVNIHV